ncbi:MAG: hypothetical protein ACREIT_01085 [Tepidisphaeraceae bacterium]
MFSIRNVARGIAVVVFGGLGGALPAGCQIANQPTKPEPLVETPLVVDEATQRRDWDRSIAYYANTSVVAGPTLFIWEAPEDMPDWQRGAWEPLLFIGNTVALPVAAVLTPPWTAQTYRGVALEPTHFAVPPAAGRENEPVGAAPPVAPVPPVVIEREPEVTPVEPTMVEPSPVAPPSDPEPLAPAEPETVPQPTPAPEPDSTPATPTPVTPESDPAPTPVPDPQPEMKEELNK